MSYNKGKVVKKFILGFIEYYKEIFIWIKSINLYNTGYVFGFLLLICTIVYLFVYIMAIYFDFLIKGV